MCSSDLETLTKLNPDIAIIPEFGDYERIDPEVMQGLGKIGYEQALESSGTKSIQEGL